MLHFLLKTSLTECSRRLPLGPVTLPMLEGLTDDQTPELIWPITSLENLKAKSVELVQSAQKSILLSLLGGRTSLVKNLFRAG